MSSKIFTRLVPARLPKFRRDKMEIYMLMMGSLSLITSLHCVSKSNSTQKRPIDMNFEGDVYCWRARWEASQRVAGSNGTIAEEILRMWENKMFQIEKGLAKTFLENEEKYRKEMERCNAWCEITGGASEDTGSRSPKVEEDGADFEAEILSGRLLL